MVWIVIALALLVLFMGIKMFIMQDRYDTEKVAHAFASAAYDTEINDLIGRIDEITYGTNSYELAESNRQLAKAQSDIEALQVGWDEMQDSYEQDRLTFMERIELLESTNTNLHRTIGELEEENKAQAEGLAQWTQKALFEE